MLSKGKCRLRTLRRKEKIFLIFFLVLGTIISLSGCSSSSSAPESVTKPSIEPTESPVLEPLNFVSPAKTLSAGHWNTCAIQVSGKIKCWGLNYSGQLNIPTDIVNPLQVVTDNQTVCAVTAAKKVLCWGQDDYGVTQVPKDLTGVVQVALNGETACTVNDKGKVVCWGGYRKYEIPSDLGKVVQISAAVSFCALNFEGSVRCWGPNDEGQTDVPGDLDRVIQISSGMTETCALTESGQVRCWGGSNCCGQLDVPDDLIDVKQVDVGDFHVCAITSTGVRCWGDSEDGQTDVPDGLSEVTQITAAYYHTCASSSLGKVTCWGATGRSSHDEGQASPPSSLGLIRVGN